MPVEAPSAETLKDIYARMWCIRLFEESGGIPVQAKAKSWGALHKPTLGEEAVAVPFVRICIQLITSPARTAATAIASQGADIKR